MQMVTDEELREAAAHAVDKFGDVAGYRDWFPRLESHIAKVQAAGREEFMSPAFQDELWDGEAVSATGMGHIDVTAAKADSGLLALLWDIRHRKFPDGGLARAESIAAAWQAVAEAAEKFTRRRPRLKIHRVLAALLPSDFTTIAHARKLRQLAKAMGIGKTGSKDPVVLHAEVLARLEQALGRVPAPPDPDGVRRMALPWLLYAAHIQAQGDEATEVEDEEAPSEKLNPLPAERRRKGLLAIAGYLPAIRSMIEFARDGCTREDLREHIKSVNPKLSDPSVNTNINALIAEWGVLKAAGNDIQLTPRGEALLETGDPEEVSDWLLTRILGFDNVLYRLREGPAKPDQMGSILQDVNPGWTTRFAPDVLVKWVGRLGLAALNSSGEFQLTEDGKAWAERIHWTPGKLPTESAKPETAVVDTHAAEGGIGAVKRPELPAVAAALAESGFFAARTVAALDAGLWLHSRRHFAVLTGLSGAGKTLLARSYGRALWSGSSQLDVGTLVLPVQPGWQDPSPLLGYVNPLSQSIYVRPPFLDFLLAAAGDPSRPYTVVLDEMNLSHPEQYLAPLLSAMETGDPLVFHGSDEEISGVPPAIAYPSNLVIIGTVNMDETTHGLSDKVLDRACVIDFWKVDVTAYPGWKTAELPKETLELARSTLSALSAALEPVRLHFGWRTVSDIIGFLQVAATGATLSPGEALDQAVYSKILPKLRGEDSVRLRTALKNAHTVMQQQNLPLASEKVAELLDDLREMGSARFWR